MITELSRSPTDNLYKFMTFGGIALIAIASGLFYGSLQHYNINLYAVEEMQATARASLDDYKLRMEEQVAAAKVAADAIGPLGAEVNTEIISRIKSGDMNAALQAMEAWGGSPREEALAMAGAIGRQGDLKGHLAVIDEAAAEVAKPVSPNSLVPEELHPQMVRLTLSHRSLRYATVVSFFVATGGLFAAGFGFHYWYYRFQRYQDDTIELQTRKLRLEVIAAEKSASASG